MQRHSGTSRFRSMRASASSWRDERGGTFPFPLRLLSGQNTARLTIRVIFSGKSSFILALLRLLDLEDGAIVIDGLDLTTIPVSHLRRFGVVCVPQDCFILPGATLRFNLDPYLVANDSEIAECLAATGLWTVLAAQGRYGTLSDANSHATHVLDKKMSTFPALSVGQTQLLAISRALVQARACLTLAPRPERRPIVLLDEVSSSLDSQTEATIHRVIYKYLIQRGHTVVIVSHRLGAFRENFRPGTDKVTWMEDGKIRKVGMLDEILRFDEQAVSS